MTTKFQFKLSASQPTFTGEECPPLAATKLIQTIELSVKLEKGTQVLEKKDVEVALKSGLWKSLAPGGAFDWYLAQAVSG